MTPLRQRMIEELQRHNYSQATIESYIFSVKEYAEFRKVNRFDAAGVLAGHKVVIFLD